MKGSEGGAYLVSSAAEAIRSLSVGDGGHWGIVTENPVLHSGNDVLSAKLGEDRRAVVARFECTSKGDIINLDTGYRFPLDDLQPQLDDLFREITQSRHKDIVRCVFSSFDNLSVDEQCTVLRVTRGVREEQNELRMQTVVTGAWNLFRVQEHWRIHYHEISPVPDRKHVFFDGPRTVDDIRAKLRAAELISNPPSDHETTCADMLLEVTGGDAFLLDYIVDSLVAQQYRLDRLESAIAQTIESAEVVDEFARRCTRLNSTSWRLLTAIANQQFVSVRYNDSDAEDLRLQGLVNTRVVGGLNICLSLRSVIVDALLRAKWPIWASDQPSIYDGKDLARPNVALNTAAYRLISQIETALRNLLVLSLSSDSHWTVRIDQVKALARDSDGIGNELLGLVREIQNALAPYVGDTEANALAKPIQPEATEVSTKAENTLLPGLDDVEVDESAKQTIAETTRHPSTDKTLKKPKQSTVLEKAENWRSRNHANTALDLAGDSLIYFITSEGLVSILANEKQGIYPVAVERFFPNKAELSTFLEHYIAIRAAVAHNQPITLGTLRRLENMREDLEKRLYRAQPSISELQARSDDTRQ